MNKKKTWYTSWIAIIIALFIFWPVGCALIYLRWYERCGKYIAINRLLLTLACGFLGFGLLGVIVILTQFDLATLLIMLFIFVLPGAILGLVWWKRKNVFDNYKKYLDYINVRKKIKLDSLCNKMNVGYDEAVNDLTEMLNKGLLKGYLEDDELILEGFNKEKQEVKEVKAKKETKIVKCKECGAKNTIVIGEDNECEYCGSAL